MVTTSRLLVAFVFTATMLSGPGPASAQEAFETAREQIDELRYEDALTTLDASLRSGKHGPADLARLYLFLGELHASMGDEDKAIDSFRRALLIDPTVELDEGLSPKISEPYQQAKKWLRDKTPVRIVHRILERKQRVIAVILQSNPLDLMAGARLSYWTADGQSDEVSASGKDRIDLQVPNNTERFVAAGIDQYGNRVVELGSAVAPLTLDPDEIPTTSTAAGSAGHRDSSSGSLITHWAVWGGVALAFAGVGTWAGLTARAEVDELDRARASSEQFEFSDVKAVADRAERRALIANISFAAAGASAIAATYFFLRRDKGSKRSAERAAVVPAIGEHSAGVTAWFRF